MKNFIEVYENAISDRDCDLMIDIFNSNKDIHFKRSDIEKNNDINDTFFSLLFLNHEKKILDLLYRLDAVLKEYYFKYAKKYPKCKLDTNENCLGYKISDFKIQRTEPGEGFLSWHHERWIGAPDAMNRFLVYTIYLNDIKEGGETEFLYQKTSISPRKGTLSLFPAEYTHVHRGNTPKNETKYILTGWYEHQ